MVPVACHFWDCCLSGFVTELYHQHSGLSAAYLLSAVLYVAWRELPPLHLRFLATLYEWEHARVDGLVGCARTMLLKVQFLFLGSEYFGD